jgi:prepilin-type processing-associated H-X9-DG protein
MAFMLYGNEHKGNLPHRNASNNRGHQQWDWIYWQKTLPPGTINESNVVRFMSSGKDRVVEEALRCPSDTDYERRQYSYSYTVSYFVMTNNVYPRVPPGPFDRSLNLAKVKSASQKILAIEEDDRSGGTPDALNDGIWIPMSESTALTVPPLPPGTNPGSNYLCIRHDRRKKLPDDGTNWNANVDRRGNAVFLDGHAEYISRRQAHDARNLLPDYAN